MTAGSAAKSVSGKVKLLTHLVSDHWLGKLITESVVFVTYKVITYFKIKVSLITIRD